MKFRQCPSFSAFARAGRPPGNKTPFLILGSASPTLSRMFLNPCWSVEFVELSVWSSQRELAAPTLFGSGVISPFFFLPSDGDSLAWARRCSFNFLTRDIPSSVSRFRLQPCVVLESWPLSRSLDARSRRSSDCRIRRYAPILTFSQELYGPATSTGYETSVSAKQSAQDLPAGFGLLHALLNLSVFRYWHGYPVGGIVGGFGDRTDCRSVSRPGIFWPTIVVLRLIFFSSITAAGTAT